MKKNIIKLIAAFLSFVVILSNNFTLLIGAEENSDVAPTFLDTPASFYFSALNNNYGNNANNSCGYLAVSMLLSFYDHYWHNDIIPDAYNSNIEVISFDWNAISATTSPGIKSEVWPLKGVLANMTYDQAIDLLGPEQFLHLELLRLGRDELKFETTLLNDDNIRWTTTDEMIVELLEFYFHNYLPLRDSDETTNYVTINYDTYENYDLDVEYDPEEFDPDKYVRDEIIAKVKSGIPVIYLGNSGNGMGHAMIAYDYDEKTDSLYLHSGLKRNNESDTTFYMNDKDPNFVYKENLSCIWIDIDETKLSHKCSVYYKDAKDNLCYCMCEFHEYLVHNHTGKYGEYTTVDHIRNCDWCGDVLEEHSIFHYSKYTTVKHKAYCGCGHLIGTYFHVVAAGGIGFKLCIHCGERIDSLIDITPVPGTNSTGGITYITEAGSYVDSDGVIYLVESDMRLYLDGQLDVYELVDASSSFIFK